jgi:Xaa-Pro aminopeptidase
MANRKVGVLFISKPADINWISGFTGTAAYIIISENDLVFVTDSRYATHCRETLSPCWQLKITANYRSFLLATGKKYKKITVMPDTAVKLWGLLKVSGADVDIAEDDFLQKLRSVKEPEELKLLREEYLIAGRGFLRALQEWRYGQPERRWAAVLEFMMKLEGAYNPSFDTIVASGARGALPHGVASDKIIMLDDAVTVDFGSSRLYNSDYTRVVYDGKDAETLKIIDIVRGALEKSMDMVKPGVKCSALHKTAKEYITKAGYGKYFNHSLGHGVGIEIHEQPLINLRSGVILADGMIFTIEPGIYIPGKYGVRLEETVAVHKTGCELLSGVLDKYVYNL